MNIIGSSLAQTGLDILLDLYNNGEKAKLLYLSIYYMHGSMRKGRTGYAIY